MCRSWLFSKKVGGKSKKLPCTRAGQNSIRLTGEIKFRMHLWSPLQVQCASVMSSFDLEVIMLVLYLFVVMWWSFCGENARRTAVVSPWVTRIQIWCRGNHLCLSHSQDDQVNLTSLLVPYLQYNTTTSSIDNNNTPSLFFTSWCSVIADVNGRELQRATMKSTREHSYALQGR